MHCYLVPPGIRFQDYLFTEPVQLSGWRPPKCAGIAVILTRNTQWGPKPLQPLYFGECGNVPRNLHRDDLFIAVLPLPYSSTAQRHTLCHELSAAYNQVTTADLSQKIDMLEARQQEQSQQILSLLTYIGRLFEPQAVGPRKPIGFLAKLAEATETGS